MASSRAFSISRYKSTGMIGYFYKSCVVSKCLYDPISEV